MVSPEDGQASVCHDVVISEPLLAAAPQKGPVEPAASRDGGQVKKPNAFIVQRTEVGNQSFRHVPPY